ncbi:MAG: SEL1-like repeat protein [Erysipelotrichaceae bacterium]|nr:SEL1-like repeat protein [Erysipelotrichaceae bacterium]
MTYLIEGDEKALLIDTGSGFGSLKKTVSRITDKEVIVLISHGHVDHAMGAGEFADIYMNHADDYIYGIHCKDTFRQKAYQENPDLKNVEYIQSLPLCDFKPLNEGDVFFIGGEEIEVYALPGHTRGSLCFLLKNERILFTGDAANDATFLFEDYSSSINEYHEQLKLFAEKTDGKYDRIITSHHSGETRKDLIEGLIRICEDIKNGNTDDMALPFTDKGVFAKAVKDFRMERTDGGIGNIVYSKDRIYGPGEESFSRFKECFADQNYQEAMKYLLESADAGYVKAQSLAGNGYLNGQMGSADPEKAFCYSFLAEKQGDAQAMTNLARQYLEGIGTDIDYDKAYDLLKRAADVNYFKAFRYLGLIFLNGQGRDKDPETAFVYFKKGADLNDITSQYYLGYCFEDGIGTKPNIQEAIQWYRKSSVRDDEVSKPAREALKRLGIQ